MPIGSSKLGVLGAGLVPGGSVTFNTSGNWDVPPGVKKVSITGKGATGNPGNPGNPGNAGNPGYGGLGGGGAGSGDTPPGTNLLGGNGGSVFSGSPCVFNTRITNYGQAGVGNRPTPAKPVAPAPVVANNPGGNPGGSGPSGASGSAGSAGQAGNPGQASSGLGNTFPGGAGGNAGAAGNSGTGGSGGGGGQGGGSVGQNANAPCNNARLQGGAGGTGAGSGGNGGTCAWQPSQAPIPPPGTAAGGGGGGGAGTTNNGQNGQPHAISGPSFYTALGGTTSGFNAPVVNFGLGPSYTASGSGGIGGSGICSGSGSDAYSVSPSGPGPNRVNTTIALRCATNLPNAWKACVTPTNSVIRSGSGGGAGGRTWPNSRPPASGGGGGGGGRGNAGNPGGAGGGGGTGATANPLTFNCVPVTPGATVPITVASPGGQVIISWNPQ